MALQVLSPVKTGGKFVRSLSIGPLFPHEHRSTRGRASGSSAPESARAKQVLARDDAVEARCGEAIRNLVEYLSMHPAERYRVYASSEPLPASREYYCWARRSKTREWALRLLRRLGCCTTLLVEGGTCERTYPDQDADTPGLVDATTRAQLLPRQVRSDGGSIQANGGLSDFSLVLQTCIATKVEYARDLTDCWLAVFQLEQAAGSDVQR